MSRTARTSAPKKIPSRAGIAACALMLLAGCETAALVPLAAYTADGLSYVSSGKGLADHAISAAADRDCALYRLAQGGGLCAVGDSLRQAPALAMAERTAAAGESDERIRRIIARSAGWRADERAAGWRPEERTAGGRETAGSAKDPVRKDSSSIPFN